jgi:hypothetical protein
MTDSQYIKDIFNWLETGGIKYENTPEQKLLGLNILKEEYDELVTGLINEDREEILDGCVDEVWMLCNNLVFNGISYDEFMEYFQKVAMSNWSKFCSTQEIAEGTVKAYQNGDHWDKPGVKIDCYWEQVGNVYVIKRNDGKILKSIFYTDVKNV